MIYFLFSVLEHFCELHHASESENILELDEVGLQIPNHPPPPPPVPVYTQINITIPSQTVSPQLDSLGSSPRSDYSSYSSSSSKIYHNAADTAKEKIITEIKNLTPKLKKTNVSGTQSPKLNQMISSLETSSAKNVIKRVSTGLFVPINNYEPTISYCQLSPLPDNLTYTNDNPEKVHNGNGKTFINSITVDAKDYKNRDDLSDVPICCECNIEIVR